LDEMNSMLQPVQVKQFIDSHLEFDDQSKIRIRDIHKLFCKVSTMDISQTQFIAVFESVIGETSAKCAKTTYGGQTDVRCCVGMRFVEDPTRTAGGHGGSDGVGEGGGGVVGTLK
jgi:hypothetical protein